MIVVHTNVVAYLFIRGQHTAEAPAILARDPEWAAPVQWRSEFRNVLALYLRKAELSLRQAVSLQEAAEDMLAGSALRCRRPDSRRASALPGVHAARIAHPRDLRPADEPARTGGVSPCRS